MFTAGCGVAGIESQYQVRDSVRPHAAPEGNGLVRMEMGVTSDRCPPFRGLVYGGQPSVVNSMSGGTQPTPLSEPPPAALKLGQGGFKKVCRTEEDSPCPFPGLASGVLEMRVKEGSKIRNLMGFAMARMQGEIGVVSGDGGGGDGGTGTGAGIGGGGGGLRQVVFSGSGRAVTKTITCAEIMKRKVGRLHQLTKLRYKGVQEVWESHEGGASEMTVHRTVPAISILLSKDPLDPQEPGYQPPETLSALWEEREGVDASPTAGKRPLGPSLHSSFHDSKRVCLGVGVGVGVGVEVCPPPLAD